MMRKMRIKKLLNDVWDFLYMWLDLVEGVAFIIIWLVISIIVLINTILS